MMANGMLGRIRELESALTEARERERQLRKALKKARTFMIYAQHELQSKHADFEQFPCQQCADKYIDIANDALARTVPAPQPEPQTTKLTDDERRKILRDLARAEVADGMYEDMPEPEAMERTVGRGE